MVVGEFVLTKTILLLYMLPKKVERGAVSSNFNFLCKSMKYVYCEKNWEGENGPPPDATCLGGGGVYTHIYTQYIELSGILKCKLLKFFMFMLITRQNTSQLKSFTRK